jgi:hypothetical protein
MVAALLIDLQTAHHAIVAEQQRLFGDLLKTAGVVDPPSKKLADATPAPPQAASAERPGGDDESGKEKRGRGSTPAPDERLRSFAAEVLSGLMERQIKQLTDRQQAPSRLKMAAKTRVEAFAADAAAPIADALANCSKLRVDVAAARVPALLSFLDGLKSELCKEGLRKSFSKQIMSCLPIQKLGDGTAHTLSIASKIETSLSEKIKKLGDEAAALKRHLTPGGVRGLALSAVLKTATKYNVRVGTFEGSFDMLRMAWSRSRVDLTKDELELEHLATKLAALEAQETTVHNWRDTADTWISVLRLRGQLQVQAAQAVLDCLCGDDAVMQALSAAELLVDTQGEPPSALVIAISKGPGAHIRNHGQHGARHLILPFPPPPPPPPPPLCRLPVQEAAR